MYLILRPSTPPDGVDLLDRELLGLHRARLGDRHGAGDRMQDADRHFGVGHGEAGRVDSRTWPEPAQRRISAAIAPWPEVPPCPSAVCGGAQTPARVLVSSAIIDPLADLEACPRLIAGDRGSSSCGGGIRQLTYVCGLARACSYPLHLRRKRGAAGGSLSTRRPLVLSSCRLRLTETGLQRNGTCSALRIHGSHGGSQS